MEFSRNYSVVRADLEFPRSELPLGFRRDRQTMFEGLRELRDPEEGEKLKRMRPEQALKYLRFPETYDHEGKTYVFNGKFGVNPKTTLMTFEYEYLEPGFETVERIWLDKDGNVTPAN